ncbi:hypothetical protein HYALB_00013124 [Hymenoscyphus albidus]|uniref:Uncharacterized protein n=1 Tax=Hymenoscyphus albidus TaxID=595503 RepID=A0A9N9PYU1_9HELO|nr:hypothetical protein HYALB_00013124 [Hymenoscyphus albidus]
MSSNSSCKAGGEWWECQLSVPTFQGCCTVNPCNSNGRCSQDDLRPASFASTGKDDDDKSPASKGPSTTIYTTGVVSIVSEGGANARPTTILVTTTASSNPSTITTSVTPQIPQDTHHNPGMVAGIAVGAVAGVLLLVGAIAGITKWRQKRRRERVGYPRLSGGPGDLGGNVDVSGAKSGSGGVMDDADPESNHRADVDKL